jgi:DNA-binding FrmR family transcriptional regulator
VQLDDRTMDDALVNLRKVQGQVAGVIRMIEQGRDCREVVRQTSAASHALERVGFRLVASGLKRCVSEGDAAAGVDADELERMFLSIG